MPEEIKANVLLVDDEEQFVKVFSQRLEGRGLKVDTSTTGEEAIQRVKSKEFDAIILDLINDLNIQAPSPDENPLGAVMKNTKAPKKSCKLARKLLLLLAKTYHEDFAKKLLEK